MPAMTMAPLSSRQPCRWTMTIRVESLAARVFAAECELYPQAIQLFAEDRLRIEGRRVRILPAAAS